MPCAGTNIQAYGSHLIELERLVTEAQGAGLVCIAGDFNAHIGVLNGVNDKTDPEGLLIQQWVDKCALYATSLFPTRSGPTYTYFNADKHTTVDYIFADNVTAEYINSCYIHDHHALNSSDHLPISCEFLIPHQVLYDGHRGKAKPKINWEKAVSSGKCTIYHEYISQEVTKVLDASYSNVEEINQDIMYVSRSIQEAALSTLPLHKPAKKQKKWYSDNTLSNLCKQKKEAWDKWKEAGSPREGVLYEQKKALRDEVRKRIKICRANEERKRIEKIDHDFRNKHPSRFRTSNSTQTGSKVCISGNTISDSPAVLQAWRDHFEKLGNTRDEDDVVVRAANERVNHLWNMSYRDCSECSILDGRAGTCHQET